MGERRVGPVGAFSGVLLACGGDRLYELFLQLFGELSVDPVWGEAGDGRVCLPGDTGARVRRSVSWSLRQVPVVSDPAVRLPQTSQ